MEDTGEDTQFYLFGEYYIKTRESHLYIATKSNAKIVLNIGSLQELSDFAKIMCDSFYCLHHGEEIIEEKTQDFSAGTKYVLNKQLQMHFTNKKPDIMTICNVYQLSFLCCSISNMLPICYGLSFKEITVIQAVFSKANVYSELSKINLFFENIRSDSAFKHKLTIELSKLSDMPSKAIIYCLLGQHSSMRFLKSCFLIQQVGIIVEQ
jgi:hypothetical protein